MKGKDMEVNTLDIIIYFIKILIINMYTYYSFKKITNIKNLKNNIIWIILFDIIMTIICSYIKFYINSFVTMIITYILYGCIIGIITKNKIGYSIVITIISYAICLICLVISIIVVFLPYKVINIENKFLYLILILIIQFIILYKIFKIKRFKNGFYFLHRRLNNDFADIIMLNISIAVILVVCLLGMIFEDIEEIRKNLLISFIILGITMFIMIQKTLTMYYKQKLLEDTLQEYQKDIKGKNTEIEELRKEKFNISKITHEFFNRQKALELAVSNKTDDIELINRIHNLTEEYSTEISKIKTLDKLQLTNIPEIDDMFKYMQKECFNNKIRFKLKIEGNIYYLINNIISKNKLETLIGDHIRDAINAVNNNNIKNREIFVILGIKENKYELCIYDTGLEFEINTLLKLGLENVTTNADKGGKGIGFITTFETMKQTGASLIIEEFDKNNNMPYTKAIRIRFDNKNEYKICSYRANEIKSMDINKRIILEQV